jgi:hypothetical protein
VRPGHVNEGQRDERAHQNGNHQHSDRESYLPASGDGVTGHELCDLAPGGGWGKKWWPLADRQGSGGTIERQWRAGGHSERSPRSLSKLRGTETAGGGSSSLPLFQVAACCRVSNGRADRHRSRHRRTRARRRHRDALHALGRR